MKIAAQLYTVRDFLKTPSEIEASLKRVKQIGYNAVQVSGLGPIEPQTLKTIADELGLKICATHVPYRDLQNDMAAVVATHQLWGCKYVGIGSMPDAYRSSREGFEHFAEQASEYGRELASEGLKLVYHNHNFEFVKFDGVTGMEILRKHFTDDVDFELDVYWAQAGGADPVEWIHKLAGRMNVVHLKDMAMSQDIQPRFAEVGEGNMNWRGILGACGDIGVKWGAVEQDVCPGDPFESLAVSLRNLRNMDGVIV